MKILIHARRSLRQTRNSLLGICALSIAAFANATPILDEAKSSTLAAALANTRASYQQAQWSRLAKAQDRDSLIAAVLIGIPDVFQPQEMQGQAELESRLARNFADDRDAAFVLALACQLRAQVCEGSYQRLLKIDPNNALNWLLLPNGGTPSAQQLHSAASAAFADTQLRMMVRMVNNALLPSSPTAVKNVDALANALRVELIEQIMLPKFAAVVTLCKSPEPALSGDCIKLARLLFADRDGAILTKMVGSTMVRRLLKGSDEESAAKQLRLEYVWLSEQLQGIDDAQKAQLQLDLSAMGEWEATQLAVHRLGKPSKPAPGWAPKDAQTLLLPEQRAAASAK